MKVLKLNQFFLESSGILSYDESPTPIQKTLKLFINCIVVFGLLYCFVLCSTIYIYRNPNDVWGAAVGLVLIFGGLSMLGSYAGFISNESDIKIVYRELQNIVNNGKYWTEINSTLYK